MEDCKRGPNLQKGPIYEAENYRPVSLTCIPCKLLEHTLCSHIHSHLDSHQALTPLNHSFRAKHSCETQLLITMQRSSWYVCTCDTAVGLNWPNLVQLHCARVYPSPSRFPTRFPQYKLLPKQSGPDRPPAQFNLTKSSLYSCQEFKLSKSQGGCWQWEFAS